MRITNIKSNISFKSGYPTFGGCGHLSKNESQPKNVLSGHWPPYCCKPPEKFKETTINFFA